MHFYIVVLFLFIVIVFAEPSYMIAKWYHTFGLFITPKDTSSDVFPLASLDMKKVIPLYPISLYLTAILLEKKVVLELSKLWKTYLGVINPLVVLKFTQ